MALRSRRSVPGNGRKPLEPGITKVGDGKSQIEVWANAEGVAIGLKKRWRKADGDKGMMVCSSTPKAGQREGEISAAQRLAQQRPELDYAANKELLRSVFWQHHLVIDAEAAYVVVPTEGESDAEFLTEASRAGLYGVPTGLLGTTTWSSSTWDAAHTKVAQQLKAEGRLGPFIADNDPTGHKYAKMRQAAVPDHPVLMPPTPGHDIKDHFLNGGTWDELIPYTAAQMAEVAAQSEAEQKLKQRMYRAHERMKSLILAKHPDWFQSADCPPGQYEGPCWFCQAPRQLRYNVREHKDIKGGAEVTMWCQKCQVEYVELLPSIGATEDDRFDLPKVGFTMRTTAVAAGSEIGLLHGVDVCSDEMLSDSQNGRHMAEILKGSVVWVSSEKDFYIFTPHGWRRDHDSYVSRMARDLAEVQFHTGKAMLMKAGQIEAAYKEADVMPEGVAEELAQLKYQGAALMKHGASGATMPGRKRTMEAFRDNEGVMVGSLIDSFNQNPRLIACLDKAVILTDTAPFFEIRDLRSDDYTTMNTGVAVRIGATHKVWSELQSTFWPEVHEKVSYKGVREYKQRMYGYSLQAGNPERWTNFLFGNTTGGKTTEHEGIGAALGSYAASYGQSIFHGDSEDKPRPDLIRLMNKRFIFASEASGGWTLHADQVKRLGGGDSFPLRDMRSSATEFIDMAPNYTAWMSTNHAPRLKGMDEAVMRRICAIPCPVSLPREKEDASIRSRIKTEKAILEAILWWLVEGWIEYRKRGLVKQPAAIVTATRKFLQDASDAGDFFTEQLAKEAGSEVMGQHIYDAYINWCTDNYVANNKILSKKQFDMQMAALFKNDKDVTKKDVKSNGRRIGVKWIGLAIVGHELKDIDPDEEGDN